MPANITVLYPSGADATFNMDYYLSTHMPLVQKTWGPEGLTDWKILKFPADQPYSVQATLEFKSLEAFKAATEGEGAKTVLGDIVNFSNKQPVIVTGDVIAKM